MKTIANCAICGAHLVGENLNRIGDRFYCQSDYQKELEKPINRQIEEEDRRWKNLLTPFSNLVSIDFDDWTASGITASSKELTVSGSGTIRYESEMIFGLNYKLSTRFNKNGVVVAIYNYMSDDSIQKTLDENAVFTSVGKSLIISLTGTGTVTVEQLTLEKV